MENVFDALCSALSEPSNKKLFQQGEGVELMVIIMKYVGINLAVSISLSVLFGDREKMAARSLSIKVLDHALSGPAGSQNCETFVEVLGLKTLFSAFMGKV